MNSRDKLRNILTSYIESIVSDKWALGIEDEIERLIQNEKKEQRQKKNNSEIKIAGWLSKALDDSNVCNEMKLDIVEWFTFFDESFIDEILPEDMNIEDATGTYVKEKP